MYVKVRAIAGAKKESFIEVSARRFSVCVTEPAQQNLANRRVIEMIAAHYRVSTNAVRIVSGHHSPSKIFSIPD